MSDKPVLKPGHAIEYSKALGIYQYSELAADLLGMSTTNPFIRSIAGSRIAMLSSEMGQLPEIVGHSPAGCMSGTEYEFGKYCYTVNAPVDMLVLAVIPKYLDNVSGASVHNDSYTIIFEGDYEDRNGDLIKKIGCLDLPKHLINNIRFGAEYVRTGPIPKRLRKGDVIAKPSSVTDKYGWESGIEMRVAVISTSDSIEDGVRISTKAGDDITVPQYRTYTIPCGRKQFPCNIGKEGDMYKIHPEKGERVSADGIIAVLRDFNEEMAPVQMSEKATRNIDHLFDTVYRVPYDSVVTDVEIIHDYSLDGNVRGKRSILPETMVTQLQRYLTNGRRHHVKVVDTYMDLCSRIGKDRIQLTPQMSRLVATAYATLAGSPDQPKSLPFDYSKATRDWRTMPTDEWLIKITVRYEYGGLNGSKVAGRHGDKGVVCVRVPPEDQPGIDMIIDPTPTINRSNPARLFEIHINSSCYNLMVSIDNELSKDNSPENRVIQSERIYRFMAIISPVTADFILDEMGVVRDSYLEEALSLFRSGFPGGFVKVLPTDNPVDYIEVVSILDEEFPPHREHVTFTNQAGRTVTTKTKCIVGSMYILRLEKLGNTQSGVGTAKRSAFSTAIRSSGQSKDSDRIPIKPIRFGEAELKHLMCFYGPERVGEFVKVTNSPVIHNKAIKAIMDSKTPFNIVSVVKPSDFLKYKSRMVEITEDIDTVSGRKLS